MIAEYQAFLESKRLMVPAAGREVAEEEVNPALFPFQRQLVCWAVRKGRAALFCTTGMGKTRMQLEWARLIGERTLILAPLAVARQTVREGEAIGIPVTYARSQEQATQGITITNYEMLGHFDPLAFCAVVLDESGILKSFDGKTKAALIAAFARTPYRLCATATPAPNDIVEIANHAEFLGVVTRQEMLASFFVNRDDGWGLKGHAREPFYRWLASWGMSLNKPSDIGFNDAGYDLPPLSILPSFVATDAAPANRLFFDRLQGVTERASVRKATIRDRVDAVHDLLQAEPDERWIFWCGLNLEADLLSSEIGTAAVNVEGSQSPEVKAAGIEAFLDGSKRYLVTKPSVAGFGLNLQCCARMAFVGLSDSYEQYFQAIRRCWRFGQTREVKAWIVLTEPERVIFENVQAKEREAMALSAELVKNAAEFEREELGQATVRQPYVAAREMRLPEWIR